MISKEFSFHYLAFTPYILLLCSLIHITIGTTTISTFIDVECKQSYDSFDGPNGYPDGLCTELKKNGLIGSFQVIQQDPGCSVSIYSPNADPNSPCSSAVTELAEIAKCYNASWAYYSIDMCSPPSSERSGTATLVTTATSSASASSKPDASDMSSGPNVAAIAGGVGGGVGLIIILNVAFWIFFIRRRRRRTQEEQASMHLQQTAMPPKKRAQYDAFSDPSEIPPAVPPKSDSYHELESPRIPAAGSTMEPVELPDHGAMLGKK
ncbi:hypothetical protein AJ80_06755 [Polytolypa hystricis UAMH7299]|uniref:Uncharacterized protein n=1 Tax=Polytolypa hystricis (strain UAMH7299) TaxID=1447883 RepID=A0A2B7XTT0_POLH7|nr:hypothetical protein AJ80_06755 [Polytolypa hystricis UAMH7299]